jgi:hypothetical protein
LYWTCHISAFFHSRALTFVVFHSSFHSPTYSAAKDAAAAQRAKDKAKRKGSFFGFGGSSASAKDAEEKDAEEDYENQEEVSLASSGCF